MSESNTLEIRVKASTHPNKLAGSIFAAFMEGRDIVLTAIGPVPISQAYKAVVVANRYLAPKGVMLAIIPGLSSRPIFDKESGTTVQWVVAFFTLRDIMAVHGSQTNGSIEAPTLAKKPQ